MRIRFLHLLVCMAVFALTACSPSEADETAPILLFCGSGSSPNSVKELEAILKDKQLKYAKVDSKKLNGMSVADLKGSRLLIVPGGNYITMGNSLTPNTAANVRVAVQEGLNYLGVCAGGLLAGNANTNSFNLTAGVRFDFYAVVNQGVHKAAVTLTNADTTTIEHYWEDGPQFSGWGDVVGKYPDGTPAIVEGTSGKGWVILCGIHPEAPENWRAGMTFDTPARTANAYAGVLINAALNGSLLPHY